MSNSSEQNEQIKNNNTSTSEEEFKTINDIAFDQKLIECYQIQIHDNKATPILLGMYPEIPLPVNKTLKYDKYDIYVVTYILSKEEIDNKIYKIIGVHGMLNKSYDSIFSVDLISNALNEKDGENINSYQIIFNDHKNNDTKNIKKIEKFPDREHVIEMLITTTFEEPIISYIRKL